MTMFDYVELQPRVTTRTSCDPQNGSNSFETGGLNSSLHFRLSTAARQHGSTAARQHGIKATKIDFDMRGKKFITFGRETV